MQLPRKSIGGLSTGDACSALIGCALLGLSTALVWTELSYDESVYLLLGRTIAESGLPLRRAYEDFTQFRLFANSPPLVLYVTAISQTVRPGHDTPARLIHVAAFALPTFAMVWSVARRRFGSCAAAASLAALLTSGTYMLATAHVLLNVPLGLFACIALIASDRAADLSANRRSWLVVVALATTAAVWTKYQAVCLATTLLAYVTVSLVMRGDRDTRSLLAPFSAMVIGGVIASAALIGFFWTFGGRELITATLSFNASRMSPAAVSTRGAVRGILGTAAECEATLGGVVLLLAAFAVCVEDRSRRLVHLLAVYVALTISFNLLFFRLPGAGTVYLHSAVPALALLAGAGAARLMQGVTNAPMRVGLAGAAVAVQIAGSPALLERPRLNASHAVASYIAARSPSTAGVLADTVAIEFYSRLPVRAAPFTYPRELVLESLEGTVRDDILFVVIDSAGVHRDLDAYRQQIDALLARNFELVPAGGAALHVYRRRER